MNSKKYQYTKIVCNFFKLKWNRVAIKDEKRKTEIEFVPYSNNTWNVTVSELQSIPWRYQTVVRFNYHADDCQTPSMFASYNFSILPHVHRKNSKPLQMHFLNTLRKQSVYLLMWIYFHKNKPYFLSNYCLKVSSNVPCYLHLSIVLLTQNKQKDNTK